MEAVYEKALKCSCPGGFGVHTRRDCGAQTKLRKGRVLNIVARPPAATAGNRDELYCAEVMRTYLQLMRACKVVGWGKLGG
jgi:hypothetical protein